MSPSGGRPPRLRAAPASVRAPMLLLYAEAGPLDAQGQAWHRVLAAAGVQSDLVMVNSCVNRDRCPAARAVRWSRWQQITDQ